MALPPERISLKRRRDDDRVDYLRFDPGRGGKRRHAEFIFRRQHSDTGPPVTSKSSQPLPANNTTFQGSGQDSYGIPTVRASAPGDETRVLAKLRAAQKARAVDTAGISTARVQGQSQPAAAGSNIPSEAAIATPLVSRPDARRFHLTADLNDKLNKAQSPGGVPIQSKRFKSIRPAVATFVEKSSQRSTSDELNVQPFSVLPRHNEAAAEPQGPHREQTPEFQRTGQTMHDHPSTWDLESDQLADELAAFAMELDPGTNHDTTDIEDQTPSQAHPASDTPTLLEDDYVYETYVRMPYDGTDFDPMIIDSDANVGLLVIDAEVEDLWQEYLNEDEDSDDEWDEEDSNAEENPVNDYPEDEVDTDDEFGRNTYKYRNHGSDDELYDQDYDD